MTHSRHHIVAPEVVIPTEASVPQEQDTASRDDAPLKQARGTGVPIYHLDDSGFIPQPSTEEPSDAQPAEVQVTAGSDGSVCDGVPDTRSLYERFPGNYPFPVYHRTGKKLPNGKAAIATTIPPQPVNFAYERKKFDVEAVRILAGEMGLNFERSRLAHLIKVLIPQMVRT